MTMLSDTEIFKHDVDAVATDSPGVAEPSFVEALASPVSVFEHPALAADRVTDGAEEGRESGQKQGGLQDVHGSLGASIEVSPSPRPELHSSIPLSECEWA